MTAIQVCTFNVEDALLAVEVSHVQEVLQEQPMTSVPLAPETVRGLINLRGQIVTAIDTRMRLGLGNGGEKDNELMNIVLRSTGHQVSILVDDIGDVMELEEELLELPPETLEPQLRAVVRAVYRKDQELMLVLDAERLLQVNKEGHL